MVTRPTRALDVTEGTDGDGSETDDRLCVDDTEGGAVQAAVEPVTGPPGGTLHVQVGGFDAATGRLALSVRRPPLRTTQLCTTQLCTTVPGDDR